MDIVIDNVLGWTALLLVAPLLTFLHELAHALVGLVVQPGRVWITLGSGSERRSWAIGRIDIRLQSPAWYASGHMGYVSTLPSPRGGIAVSVAGPLSSLVLGLSLLAVHWSTDLAVGFAHLVNAGMVFALIQALLTGIPMTYPAGMPGYAGQPSDGLRVVRRLADARAGRSEPTA